MLSTDLDELVATSSVAPFDQVIASMLDTEADVVESHANSAATASAQSVAATVAAALSPLASLAIATHTTSPTASSTSSASASAAPVFFSRETTTPPVESVSSSHAFNDSRVRAAFLEMMVALLAPYRPCLRPDDRSTATTAPPLLHRSSVWGPLSSPSTSIASVAAPWGSLPVRKQSEQGSVQPPQAVNDRGAGAEDDMAAWTDLFDVSRFVSAYPSTVRPFMRQLVATQAFQCFVTQALSPPVVADPNLSTLTSAQILFFDACVMAAHPYPYPPASVGSAGSASTQEVAADDQINEPDGT